MRAVLVFVIGVGIAGCGANVVFVEDDDGGSGGRGPGSIEGVCAELCAATIPCGGTGDCGTECEELANAAEAAGCFEQFRSLARCIADAGSSCDPGGCIGEVQAFGFCISSVCLEDPTNPACQL